MWVKPSTEKIATGAFCGWQQLEHRYGFDQFHFELAESVLRSAPLFSHLDLGLLAQLVQRDYL